MENNTIVSKWLNMVLECDRLAKEERKCLSKDRRMNWKSEGNKMPKHGRETMEKAFIEVAKERDSDNNCEEYLQHEHGEQWELIDDEASFF